MLRSKIFGLTRLVLCFAFLQTIGPETCSAYQASQAQNLLHTLTAYVNQEALIPPVVFSPLVSFSSTIRSYLIIAIIIAIPFLASQNMHAQSKPDSDERSTSAQPSPPKIQPDVTTLAISPPTPKVETKPILQGPTIIYWDESDKKKGHLKGAYNLFRLPPFEEFSDNDKDLVTTALAILRGYANSDSGKSARGIRHFLNDPTARLFIARFVINDLKTSKGEQIMNPREKTEGVCFRVPFSSEKNGQTITIGINPDVFESGLMKVLTVVTKEVVGRAAFSEFESNPRADSWDLERVSLEATLDALRYLVSNKHPSDLMSDTDRQEIRKYGIPLIEYWLRVAMNHGVLPNEHAPSWPIRNVHASIHEMNLLGDQKGRTYGLHSSA